MINKKLMMLAILLVGLLAVSAVSAADNATGDIASADNVSVSIDGTMSAENGRTNIYFDASASADGNGSAESPYSFVDASRISSNSNMYFKNGYYPLYAWNSYSNISFYGENPEETIIDFENSHLQSEDSILIKNMTFKRSTLDILQNIVAANSIFDGNCSYNEQSTITAWDNCNMLFDNCSFINNNNEYGVINLAFDCDVMISNCRFIDNLVSECGAIYSINSMVNITNSIFKNNRANKSGGAIFSSGRLFIYDSTFIDNSAYCGGSIYSCYETSTVAISNTGFYGNRAFAGGSIFDMESESLYVDGCEFINSSSVYGGALALLGTQCDISGCDFNGNDAEDGGSVYQICGNLTLTDSEFADNTAKNGGGILVFAMDNVIISNNDFMDNGVWAILSDDENLIYQNNNFINNDVCLNYIPNLIIGSGNYTLLKSDDTFNGTIPERYDPRDYGMITPAREQGTMNYCWAFATMATLESCMLKATGVQFDFSEMNVANLISIYSYGYRDGSAEWYPSAAAAYLLNWFGPVYEEDDMYSSNRPMSPILNSLFHVQNVIFIQRESQSDLNAIKEAILRYGAVVSDICFSGDYFKGYTYYNPNSDISDHTLSIVGWDDSYPKENFKITPPGDGAWIVKNSWGEADGYGCYYVSYYDTTLGISENGMFTFMFNDTVRYDRNYQYDFGDFQTYEFSESAIWCRNIFNSTGDEYLGAVSTYFDENYDWELSIYVNDELAHTQSGRNGYGYYTIGLDKYIPLKKNDVFEIAFKLFSLDGSPVCFPLMNYKYNDGLGKSLISSDNENWFYIMDFEDKPLVACIKAFTFLEKIGTGIALNVESGGCNPVNITAIISDEYGNRVNGGSVDFDLEGAKYTVNVSNGAASIVYSFKNTTDLIFATFNGAGYESSSANKSISVLPSSILTAEDVTVKYCDANGKLVATLTSAEGVPISADIVISLNGEDYAMKTDSKGQASLSTKDLKVGTYTATVTYSGSDKYDPATATAKITVTKADTVITAADVNVAYKDPDGELVATIINEHGKPLVVTLSFNINGKTYTAKTDSNGQASIPLDTLSPGTYTATISYKGSGNYKASSTTAKVKVTKADTIITAPDVSLAYKDPNGELTATIINEHGKPLVVTLSFNINGKTYTAKTDSNGQAKIAIGTLSPGTYTATITYKGSSNYKASTATSKVTVTKAGTVLTASDVTVAFKDPNGELTATIINEHGKPLAVSLNVKLNGKTYTVKTDSNGQASIAVGTLSPGTYTATISYKGSSNYQASSTTAKVKVTKAGTVISAPDVSVTYKDPNGALVATIVNEHGKPLVVSLNVNINGKDYTVKTDSNGQASIAVGSLSPGTYTATISYKGSSNYQASSTTAKVTVTKADTIITAPDVTVAKNDPDGKLVSTIVNEHGKPLVVTMKIELDGKTYSAKTNSNGQMNVSTADLATGTYTATISYKGSSNYNASITTAKIQVKK